MPTDEYVEGLVEEDEDEDAKGEDLSNEESKIVENHPEHEIRSDSTELDRISRSRKTVDDQKLKSDRVTPNPIGLEQIRSDSEFCTEKYRFFIVWSETEGG